MPTPNFYRQYLDTSDDIFSNQVISTGFVDPQELKWDLLRVSYPNRPSWSEFVELGEYGNYIYIPSVEVK